MPDLNTEFFFSGTLPEDSGNYQCVAENSITNETRTSLEGELYVTERMDSKSYNQLICSHDKDL